MNIAEMKLGVIEALIVSGQLQPEKELTLQQNMSTATLKKFTSLGSNSVYNFNPLEVGNNNSGIYGVDMLLPQNDAFVILGMKLTIGTIANDTPTDALMQNMKMASFYNPFVFTGGNGANIQALYNGEFQFSVDQKRFFPGIDCADFEYIGDTQEGATITAYVDAASADQVFTSGRSSRLSEYTGFKPVEPVLINGGQTIESQVKLAASVDMDDSGITNFTALTYRGFRIVNGKNLLALS